MAMILFVVLFLSESGLAAFTLLRQKSRKEWIRNRLIINGTELLLFIIMTLLPGIDFTFRFTGLFILLVIRVLIAGIRFLLTYKRAEGEKKKVILILGSVLISAVMLLCLIPAFVFADYNGLETSGNYDVAEKSAILIDNSRTEEFENDGSKREVPVYFYYPENAGENHTFPLVIFSHGAFGYYQSNTSTYMELASNGYVVVSMEHPYHSTFTKDTDGKLIIADSQFLNDAMTIGSTESVDDIMTEQRFRISNVWMQLRTKDMNFAIDAIKSACHDQSLAADTWALQNEDEMLEILRHIDCSKIGLMGHSMGGATAVTVGRQRDDISAVIDIDGTMLGEELDCKDGKFIINEEPYPVPLLSMSNMEHGTDASYGDDYVNNVIMRNALNAQNTYIVNSGHMNFTDLPLFSPFLASQLGTGEINAKHCIEIVNDIILNYMDSNLIGDGSYQVNEFYE